MESLQKDKKNRKLLKVIVIGATGATGRELTDLLLKSEYYSSVYVLVRRKLDRWDNLNDEEKGKLKIINSEDLDIITKEKEEIEAGLKINFENEKFDTVFCCLGSRVGRGESEFRKVDYDYVVASAALCEKFKIPHFSAISTKGADPKSWFLYLRTKGQADEECCKRKIRYVSIFRPGVILDRDNDDRFGEKMLKFVPFIDKIKCRDLAQAILNEDLNVHFNVIEDGVPFNVRSLWQHWEIESWVKFRL